MTKERRIRSHAARESTIKTCADRATVLLRLKEWLIAYMGDGSTAKQERELVAAARSYFKVNAP